MNTQISKVGFGLVACYLALFMMVNYVQVFRANDLNERPDNTRALLRDFDQPRGQVLSADGLVLARSDPTPAGDNYEFQRVYPPETAELFANITGFLNIRFGSEGIERQYNSDLAGTTEALKYQSFMDLIVDREQVGDITLTMRADIQRVAQEALGERRGSVVAIDPRDGSVLAMWSYPSYDPNLLSSHDAEVAAAAREALDYQSGTSPLVPATYRRSFFPGSTFKVVTAAIGVDRGVVTNDQPNYPRSPSFDIDFTENDLDNFGGSTCGGSLPQILANSCNSAFAAMGVETIGEANMIEGAEDFGFNQQVPIDLPNPARSTFPASFAGDEGNGPLARASIGQGDVSATPLQMALVAGTVANGGITMTPRVMAQVTDDHGDVVRSNDPKPWRVPISPQTATVIRDDMVGVVTNGSGRAAQIRGYVVGGKTGTAQLGTSPPSSHAWFVSFAGPSGEAPRVAVSVLVEAQPGVSEITGGQVAAPIARSVMEAVLNLPS